MHVPRLLILCTIAAVAGCTAWPHRPRLAPTVVPPERLARLVQELDQEWRRWGSAVVQLDDPAGSCLVQPDATCVNVDVGCGAEQAAPLCPLVNGYWAAVGSRPRNECEHVDVCATARPFGAAYHANAPWSSAFIGAMMARAGFSPTEFAREPNHAAYIVAARDMYTSAYEVLPTPAVVSPGDLVCSGRADTFLHPADLGRVGPAGFAMHCDIVVHVDLAAQRAEVIGGNVQQTVAKAVVPLDPSGQVVFDTASSRQWAFVMRARRSLPPSLP